MSHSDIVSQASELARLGARALRDSPTKRPNQDAANYVSSMQGILHRWDVVGYGFCICSIVCCAIVIVTSLALVLRKRSLLLRPSFRLSASIAVCDLIYCICQLLVYNNKYMSSLPELQLRAIMWMMSASNLTFALLSTCIGIQLLLTILLNKAHVAEKLQRWYEVASFAFGFIVTHPNMYLYKKVRWIKQIQMFSVAWNARDYYIALWLTEYLWTFACIIFLFFIVLLTYLKLANVWVVSDRGYNAPEKLDLLESSPNLSRNHMVEEHKKYVRSVTLRMACYPIIPVVTMIWLVIANMNLQPPIWLAVMGNIVPPIQGTLNFIVYIMNPAFDMYRRKLFGFRKGSSRGRPHGYLQMNDTDTMSRSEATLVNGYRANLGDSRYA
ncbi:hypothetical protein GQ54DRAFT_298206 [Martensiomyces pterosporus]|nr:hypothetical protein GQ54DRAFT_298206 [Martensiomyces pterosporus]